ncbi:MAG TPA: hypothetical protein VNK82_03760 [Terriglobales bacterium]|nr:hypothetical protein [Terriglobales bacterium]
MLCSLATPSSALDRAAFTITAWDLKLRITPAQEALSANGTVTLRNDSPSSQRVVALQVSSSLGWTSVTAEGKPLPMVGQPYVSDLDHTGSLSEVLVTLPQEVAPGNSVTLEVAYEGTVVLDAARLTRAGAPEADAKRNDWDRISATFTCLRGVGYVAWYPVTLESISLSDPTEFFDSLDAWKARHAASVLRLTVTLDVPSYYAWQVVTNGRAVGGNPAARSFDFVFEPVGLSPPTLAAGDFRALLQSVIRVYHFPGHETLAQQYVDAAQALQPLAFEWFGQPRRRFEMVELAEVAAESSTRVQPPTPLDVVPWESGSVLFTPLKPLSRESLEVTLMHPLAHAALDSPRPWIREGAAHFAQALAREQQARRSAALEYLERQLPLLVEMENALARLPPEAPRPSLITTSDEIFYRAKAAYVFWMLREMLGDAPLQRALHAYRAEDDRTPAYFQQLLEKESGRSLEWFFDDWVYRDRGLPDFRVVSTYPRPIVGGGYSVTVTVENLGGAAAEVSVTLRAEGGEATQRLRVPARDKASIRITVPTKPRDVLVNDSSVPESDRTNNLAAIALP